MLGKPPSRKAMVRLVRLCVNCGERSTLRRMSFFWGRERASLAAEAVADVGGSVVEGSGDSWARVRREGGRKSR